MGSPRRRLVVLVLVLGLFGSALVTGIPSGSGQALRGEDCRPGWVVDAFGSVTRDGNWLCRAPASAVRLMPVIGFIPRIRLAADVRPASTGQPRTRHGRDAVRLEGGHDVTITEPTPAADGAPTTARPTRHVVRLLSPSD